MTSIKTIKQQMATPSSLEMLREQCFFQFLTEEEWSSLKVKVTEYTLTNDETIFSEGESKDKFQGIYFIAKGSVSVSRLSLNGRNHYVRILESGEIFFNPGLFDGGPSPATLKAIENSNVLYIPRHALIPAITHNPKAVEVAFEALADVIRQAITVIDGLAFKDNCSRLANLLLETSDQDIIKRDHFSLQFISACINTVPEVVSRELKKLADEGLVKITRTHIIIKDRKRLEKIAQK